MDVFSQLFQLLIVGGIREGKYLNICPVTSDNENQTWKNVSRRASSSYFTLTDKGTVSADWKARTTGTGYFFHSVNDWPQQLFGMMSLGLWGLTGVSQGCAGAPAIMGGVSSGQWAVVHPHWEMEMCCAPHCSPMAVVGFQFTLPALKTDCF